MLKWLAPQPGEVIVVTAAGSGFDARLIEKELQPDSARIICVEPSTVFSKLILSAQFELYNNPLNRIELPDACADAVINLAALHHFPDRQPIFKEWVRILKPGGRLIIADVEAGSSNGNFLNQTVDALTPGGHEGIFLKPGELSEQFQSLRLHRIEESLEAYFWEFEDKAMMLEFTQLIFGMVNGNVDEVEAGLIAHMGIVTPGSELPFAYPWSLRFFRGFKPPDS